MELVIDASEAIALGDRWAGAPGIVQSEMKVSMTQSVLVVEAASKGFAPVVTGTLRRSIVGLAESHQLGIVGTNLPYAKYVHEGTGLYGPNGARIVPKTKKALYWPGADHPVKSVAGQQKQPFMKWGLAASRGQVRGIWKLLIPRIAARLRG